MRVAVVGAGAMGGTLAADCARAGLEVTVVDVAQPLASHIAEHGLVVDEPDGSFRVPVAATTRAGEVGIVDCVVVFVKAQHTEAVAGGLQPLLGPDTVVATLQNGWGNADVLAASVPMERLVMGVTYHSCTVIGPGHLAHSGRGPTVVGPYLAEGDLGPAKAAVVMLDAAGWPAEATPSVLADIWKKLILNAATLPTAALTLLPAGDLGRPGALLDLVDALASEAVRVARAQGLPIDLDERLERIHAVLAGAGTGKASMLQDIEQRRKTEIEVINGAVVRTAVALGVEVPLNRAMVALVGGLERSWRL